MIVAECFQEALKNRWEAVAARFPGKNPGQLQHHFQELLNDINLVKDGCAWPPQIIKDITFQHSPISIPIISHQQQHMTTVTANKAAPPETMLPSSAMAAATREQNEPTNDNRIEHRLLRRATGNNNERKVEHWTQEEHRLFVKGLDEFGKSKWKEISKLYVGTRNPTQVASHAQKYFNHKKKSKGECRRKNIQEKTSMTTDHRIDLCHNLSGLMDERICCKEEEITQARRTHKCE
ncbi:hypothetical protein PIB30_091303 [Stylosanthes scabra]|uniref:Uncharacterized protein n=1 Tax=Stylosanthes scabra TaxID=79078 RepID=A0ABU6YU38_9FABA|nr:hypothetical protein [Stylosanthes scabra]